MPDVDFKLYAVKACYLHQLKNYLYKHWNCNEFCVLKPSKQKRVHIYVINVYSCEFERLFMYGTSFVLSALPVILVLEGEHWRQNLYQVLPRAIMLSIHDIKSYLKTHFIIVYTCHNISFDLTMSPLM